MTRFPHVGVPRGADPSGTLRVLACALCLSLTLAGCGGGEQEEPYELDAPTGTEIVYAPPPEYEALDSDFMADDDRCTIRAVGTGESGAYAWLELEITNKDDVPLAFICTQGSFKVGGKKVSPVLYEEVDADETVRTTLDFPRKKLHGGAEKLADVRGTIKVYDVAEQKKVASYNVRLG